MASGLMGLSIERRNARLAERAQALAVFSGVLFLTSGVGHRFGAIETGSFLWLLALVAMLAVAALCLAVVAFQRFWDYGGPGGGSILRALIVALLVLTPYGVSAYRMAVYPTLSDISTDVLDPPVLSADGAPESSGISAAAAEKQLAAYPAVIGRRYQAPLDRVLAAVVDLMRSRGWRLEGPAPVPSSEVTVDAMAGSPLLRFPAQVAVRLTDEGGGTYVDMRSRSLYGRHDLGDNARRIETFLKQLDTAVGSLPAE